MFFCRQSAHGLHPSNKAVSKREWQSALRRKTWKNPILEWQKYLDCLNSNPDFTYRDIANEFGVSKTRVSQMIALIKKLPQEILDYLTNGDAALCFTERKLRPLTFMGSDEEKIDEFLEMVNNQPCCFEI